MPKGRHRNQRSGKSRQANRPIQPDSPTSPIAEDGGDVSPHRIDIPSERPNLQQRLLIVGIGASAGGLEALERFFDHMPNASGLAFVVIQHLSPDFKSLMDELLARHSRMAIHRVEDGMIVAPNSIYLMPPKKEMRIQDGRLVLTARDTTQGISLPIDVFFQSLADDCGAQAVGVVLSGSGSDGSRGVAAIHRAGGLVVVQQPDTAKFDSMPSAAIEAGVANFVLPPEQMPEMLLRHVEQPFPADTEPTANLPAIAREGELAEVFALLLDQCGIDFTHYKPTTVARRIHRRVELSGAANLDDFIVRLASDSDELNRLYKDLLIGVTQFFRDHDAFDSLHRDVLADLFAKKGPDDELRVWDAGCATGEESYSLAILLHELTQNVKRPPAIKIFATDVHRDSLDFAGAGIYDREAVAGVKSEMLERFFTREGERWRISQELRKMVVFAPHNVAKDAPFTKMDLVVCRNLLIYLQPEMQQWVLSTFHYALNVGGVLMLGPSESVAGLADEFETINGHWKLYRKRRDIRLPAQMRMPLAASVLRPRDLGHVRPLPSTAPGPSPHLLRAYDALLEESIPTGILVNERYEVAHVFGDARRFLHPPVGRATSDVLMMVEDDLRVALAAALQRASKEQRTVTYDAVPLRRFSPNDLPAGRNETGHGEDGELTESPVRRPVEVLAKLTVKPILDRQRDSAYFLISFETRSAPSPPPKAEDEFNAAEISGDRIVSLETELAYTRESLQATVEELQTSNEELQATNEELVASNEELQSTNEELHSVNEELHTVNSEYQKKIDELTQLTADMDNLLVSTDVGVIYLDLNLRVRKFTPSVAAFFNLLPQDIGRPIGHISGQIKFEELAEDVRRVLATGEACERELQNGDAPFLMRILPYLDHAGCVQGIVLAFIEISELKRAEEQVRKTGERYHTLFEASPCGFIKVSDDGTMAMVNLAAQRMFGYERDELIGKPIEILVPHEVRDAHVKMREMYFQNPHTREAGRGRQLIAVRKDGSEFPVEVGLTPIETPEGIRVLTSITDITERKRLEDQKDRLLEVAFAATAREVVAEDDAGRAAIIRGPVPAATAPASATAFEDALHTFVRQIRLAIGAHQAAINYVPDGDFSAAYHTHSFSTKYEKYSSYDVAPTGAGIWSLVIETRQPVCMTQEELVSHPRWKNFSRLKDARGLEHPPMRGWLAVPIISNESDDFMGIVQLSDKYEGDFTDDDVDMATRLAQLMAPFFALQYVNDRVNTLIEERTAELARANEALARSNSELEQFAYIASHDLQEPLRKIVSYCQLLKEEQAEKLDDDGREYLDVAVDGSKRMQTLIHDLLAFSRVTTRGNPLAVTNANDSLQEALANLDMAIEEKRAVIVADSLPTVMADHGQLTLVFQNLIGNAIKYCKESPPKVHVGVQESGGQYMFFVRDNGIGIAPEFHDRIFQIFQRLHNRREYSGTGIGLALCKRIVERFNGEIWVESTPGAGSTFYFTLNNSNRRSDIS